MELTETVARSLASKKTDPVLLHSRQDHGTMVLTLKKKTEMKYIKVLILSFCTLLLLSNVTAGKTIPATLLLLLDGEISLTGTWNIYFTKTGSEEEGPFEFGVQQEGGSLTLCESDRIYSGSINNKNVSIDFGFAQFVGALLNEYLIQGTYPEGTWRMVKMSDTSTCTEIEPWDIESNGIPGFVSANHIELSKIEQISKFRSGIGHDYSDDFESCRSMKHYYLPFAALDWSQIKIYSPVNGTILKIEREGYPNSGMQVHIRSTEYPAFTFRIFHVNVHEYFSAGASVTAGQEIGTHISNITADDIAVGVTTPAGWMLVSFMSVMSDPLFQGYKDRGAQSKNDFIVSREARDSDTLNCIGETFGTSGTIENWINLL